MISLPILNPFHYFETFIPLRISIPLLERNKKITLFFNFSLISLSLLSLSLISLSYLSFLFLPFLSLPFLSFSPSPLSFLLVSLISLFSLSSLSYLSFLFLPFLSLLSLPSLSIVFSLSLSSFSLF